ncbi:MAG: hypothetical protein FJZ04_01735 [Candidatus Moranbacteria bacterium]|nr:hypothetical protein [Candidatus Moranbacteria bacterium]
MNKLFFLTVFLIAYGLGGGMNVANAEEWRIEGFAWIGNNLINGFEQGEPVTGMIKMSGSKYRVFIEGTGPIRLLRGAAWLGIGNLDDKYEDFTSQSDLPSLGWIVFDQGTPSSDCFGAGDCYPAKWNQKSEVSPESPEGYISGWARMQIGLNENASSPKMWLHFRSPDNSTNYTCDDENHYYVCVDKDGKIGGYAWSSDTRAISKDDYPGLGWIKFSKNNVEVTEVATDQGGQISSSCQVLFMSKSSICGASGKATYKAVLTGLVPKTLIWKFVWEDALGRHSEEITNNNPSGTEITEEIFYPATGYYTPQLTVITEDGKTIGPCNEVPVGEQSECCASFSEVIVTDQKTCKIVPYFESGELIPRLNPLDPTSFYKVIAGQRVVAKTELTCVEPTAMNWSVLNGDMLSYTNDSLTSLFDVGGIANINATAVETTTDPETGVESSENISCEEARIRVREKMRYGF